MLNQFTHARRYLLIALAALLVPAGAFSQPPNDVTLQGLLLDDLGAPLTGTPTLDVSVWDNFGGGTSLYSESHTPTLADGVFSILLGTGTERCHLAEPMGRCRGQPVRH